MLEKPNLADDDIVMRLRQHHGIDVTALEFLPIGNDVGTYVYRITGRDGATHFLKARRAPMYEPSVVVPHFLNAQGLHQVVSPLPTREGALWVPLTQFNLILYPFIQGRTGMDVGLSAAQWAELGTILKKLHAIQLAPALQTMVQRESLERPYWVDEMQRLQARINSGDAENDIERDFISYWRKHNEQMNQLMARTLALGHMLHNQPRPFVLCHSDIHTANVMVDLNGALHIVDWDQPIQAPKERDLMFFGANLGSLTGDDEDARHFYAGYGPTEVDHIAFAYYRYAWVMQDWVAYGAEVLLHEGLGEITRRNSLRQFKAMFDAGDVVDVAYRSDAASLAGSWRRRASRRLPRGMPL
jgi:spectinomycin phosphotransferase